MNPPADGRYPTLHQPKASGGRSFWALTLASVGVVYGDIGTSPLYALREALRHAARDGISTDEIIGVVSLLVWTLIVIVMLKYVLILLRTDNHGEGGVLSLLALAQSRVGRRARVLLFVGIAGAALFYGDAMITPAISVLSAVEGLEVLSPAFRPFVLPVTVTILVGLFLFQHRGTTAVGTWFGPAMTVWFITIALAALPHLIEQPAILLALDPSHALRFLVTHKAISLAVLAASFLVVTGAEALYADMGHFGRRPIQWAWIALVFPALALNYLGQGALVLSDPTAIANPFFMLVEGWARLPLVILATVATIIASQAVITGAFSMTRQAIQLGLLPRLKIAHTSETQSGQIYLPNVNWLLLAAVVVLVIAFESSAALAAAYGVAVIGTMIVTTVLVFVVLWRVREWSLYLALLCIAPFAMIETAFLIANSLKIVDGGYAPILVSGCLGVVMWTWWRGTAILRRKARRASVPLGDLIAKLRFDSLGTAPGTAVFLSSDKSMAPMALLHNLKHNHSLHQHNVLLTIETADTPRVEDQERLTLARVGDRFATLVARFGYKETPNVPAILALARKHGLRAEPMTTSFFLGRRTILSDPRTDMSAWQDRLFIWLADFAADPTEFYALPPNRVIELGQQVTV